jgi:hypothetical protein
MVLAKPSNPIFIRAVGFSHIRCQKKDPQVQNYSAPWFAFEAFNSMRYD